MIQQVTAYLVKIGYAGGYGDDGFPLPNELMRCARVHLGMSQEQVARLLRTSQKTVATMELDGFRLDKVIPRRQVAAALGIPLAVLGLVDLSQTATTKNTSVDISLYKTTVTTLWEVYFSGGKTGGLKTVDGLLQSINSASESVNHSSKELLMVAAMTYQLGIDLAREERNYAAAKSYYKHAAQIAKQIESTVLLASAMIRYCSALYEAGQYEQARLLTPKMFLLKDKVPALTSGMIIVDAVKPFAKSPDANERASALTLAEQGMKMARIGKSAGDWEEGFVRLSLPQAQSRWASALIENGKVEEALNILDKAEESTSSHLQRRIASIKISQASALLQMNEHNESARVAQDALIISSKIGSHVRVAQLQELHAQLLAGPGVRAPEVKLLSAQFLRINIIPAVM